MTTTRNEMEEDDGIVGGDTTSLPACNADSGSITAPLARHSPRGYPVNVVERDTDDYEEEEEEEDDEEDEEDLEEEAEEEEEEEEAEEKEEKEVEDDGIVGRGGASEEANDRRSSPVVGVYWYPVLGKWKAQWNALGKQIYLGSYATKEAAKQAFDSYTKDGTNPVKRRDRTSQFKGVGWNKTKGKWRAECKGTHLGHHATEEAAAQACANYVKHAVVPEMHREVREGTSSQFRAGAYTHPLFGSA